LRLRLVDFDVIVKRIETFPDMRQRTLLLSRLRIPSERTP